MVIPPEILPTAMFALIIAGVGGAYAVQHYLEQKRRKAMAAAADQMGLSFQDRDPGLAHEPFSRFHLFAQGGSREFTSVLRGKLAGKIDLALFDYSYTTGSGKSRQTHRQTVAAFRVDGMGLPGFEMRPEEFFHKIGSLFGYQDIDFPESSAFSKKYLLRGKDEPAIRSVFGPAVLNHFDLHPGWCVEGKDDWLTVYRYHHRVKPEDVRAFLDEARTNLYAFSNR